MVSSWKLAPIRLAFALAHIGVILFAVECPMIAVVGRVRFVLSLGLCCVLGFACAAWGQPGVISFRLEDNLIRVPVTLNGRRVEAVLDSGTGSLGLDLAFARSLGLEPAKTTGMVPGGGAPVPMYPVVLNEIQFGPEGLTQVRGIALDLGHLSSSAKFPVQVLLGNRSLRIGRCG